MVARLARALAVAVLALTVMIVAASLILAVRFPNETVSRQLAIPVGPLLPIPFAVVGTLIVVRQPRNTVGGLLLGVGLAAALMILADIYLPIVRAAPGAPVSVGVAQKINDLGWVVTFPLMLLILQLFPAGRPLSPKWRILVWLTGIWVLFGAAIVLTRVIPRVEPPQPPLIFNIALLALIVMSVVAILMRVRRARGAERQQIKWLAFGAVPGLLVFPAAANPQNPATLVVQDVFLMWIPVTIGIAVLRYRLYDIDHLVKRTAVYATVSVMLAAVYGASVLLLTVPLSQFSEGNALAVAGSTLAAAALFQPLRGAVQRFVDRRFDRARFDGALTVAAFGTRLRDEVDLDSVLVDLQEVIRSTIGPSSASVWLRRTRGVGR